MWTAVVVISFVAASLGAFCAVLYMKHRKSITRMDYDLAMVTLKQQLRRNPRDAGAHVKMGLLLARQRKFEGAIGALNAAIEIDPKRADAHYHRALSFLQVGQPGEAEKDFEWIRANSEDAYYKTAVRTLKHK
jgi:lipoprotein NlpI